MKFAKRSTTIKLLALAIALAASASNAHATSIVAGIYTASGITVTGSTDTLTGTLTIGSTGLVTASTLTLNGISGGQEFSTIGSENSCCSPTETQYELTATNDNGGQLTLYYVFNLSGDLVLCTTAVPSTVCATSNDSSVQQYGGPLYSPAALSGGTLNPPSSGGSVTPEPPSLVLLGTGILGFAGALYRRSLNIQPAATS